MPTEVRASHILVPTEKQAQELKKKIADGEKFHKVAKRFSTCPSKVQGGDLGFFAKGMMADQFETAAFAAPKGKVVGPVKTEFGWHLIVVTESKD